MFKGNFFKRNSENRHQKSVSKKIVYGIAFTLMAFYALLVLYFFVYGILISLKYNPNASAVLGVDGVSPSQGAYLIDQKAVNLFSFPSPFGIKNFKNYLDTFSAWGEVVNGHTYIEMVWNSIWRTTSSAFLSWFTTAIVCYVLVHYKSKFTNIIYVFGLLVMMIPLYGGQGATYKLYNNLNLINNPMITFVSITLYGGYFFYMYAFWKGISHSYAEAASIDGANHYQTLFRVMLPQVLPSIVALFVMQFITAWNDYEMTAAYMSEWPNLSYGTYSFSEASKWAGNVPAFFAGVMISLLPILILFVAFQNTIMEKVYLGGLKE